MLIKAGTFMVFETGQYSDYAFTGPFVVAIEFDQKEIIELYKKQWEPSASDWYSEPTGEGMIAWMAKEGYIVDLPNVIRWHVGSYGTLEAEIQEESGENNNTT